MLSSHLSIIFLRIAALVLTISWLLQCLWSNLEGYKENKHAPNHNTIITKCKMCAFFLECTVVYWKFNIILTIAHLPYQIRTWIVARETSMFVNSIDEATECYWCVACRKLAVHGIKWWYGCCQMWQRNIIIKIFCWVCCVLVVVACRKNIKLIYVLQFIICRD